MYRAIQLFNNDKTMNYKYQLPINSAQGHIIKSPYFPLIIHHLLTYHVTGMKPIKTIFMTTKECPLFTGCGISLN